jgi:histone arginine demethylase JMJD6
MKVLSTIERRNGLSRSEFEREYVLANRPVIVTDAIDHWAALGRWTPDFFKQRYGALPLEIDGESLSLAELIDRVDSSSEAQPAPYLRNQLLREWPRELWDDVHPMPECTKSNWFESRLFPTRESLSSVEVYIGGRGACFPQLHYDTWHTHAYLMQLHGDKEYVAFAPDQTERVYPCGGREKNKSRISDLDNPDLDEFPLFEQAEGIRFSLRAGETLFVPAGWWHTARILSPSVTVSINAVDRANARSFRRDYCSEARLVSPLRAAALHAMLIAGQVLHLFAI